MKKILSIILITTFVMAAMAGTTYADSRILSQGTSGDDVLQLQYLLSDYGYFEEEATGYFGEITLDALVRFQTDAGLEADGIAGPITQDYLGMDAGTDEGEEETEDEEYVSPFSRVLRAGDTGSDVTALQQLLAVLGYFDETPTGFFGDITEASVLTFQEEYGLETDGIVGPATAGRLTGTAPEDTEDVDDTYAEEYAARVLAAIDETPAAASGYCASWVTQVMSNAGILTYNIKNLRPTESSYAVTAGLTDDWYSDSTGFNANDYWAYVCDSSDYDDLKVGMVIATRSSFTYLGKQFGHVGIYIGDGEVISSVGYLEVLSLDEWIDRYNNEDMGSTVAWGYLPE